MNDKLLARAKWIEPAAYAALFAVSFVMFAYWTFPYDRLAALLVDRVAQSGSGYTLSIGELSPYWLTGVQLEDVKLDKRPTTSTAFPAGGDAAASGARPLVVKTLHARVAVLPLLWGSRSVSFDAELDQGELSGTFSDNGEDKHVTGEIESVDLGKIGAFDSVLTVPIKGELTGEFDLSLAKEAAKSNGTIALNLKGLIIGDGKAKQKLGSMGGLTIDPIEVGDVRIALDVKSGVGTIKDMRSDGRDLVLTGSGDVRLSDPLTRSRLNLLLRANFTDNYKKKSPRTQTMFSFIDSSPDAGAAKTPDGAFQFRLSGLLSSLRAVPQGSAKPAPTGAQAGQ